MPLYKSILMERMKCLKSDVQDFLGFSWGQELFPPAPFMLPRRSLQPVYLARLLLVIKDLQG
jgi:hypothetical protein